MNATILQQSELQQLYTELNTLYFQNVLPSCEIKWSRQLTRAAGTIEVRSRLIKLSVPLLIDAFQTTSLFGPTYEICGVHCDSAETALREILKHEMIHLWLHVQGLPSGHTAQFRAQARAIGQPKTRHGITLPAPRRGWNYRCIACGHEFTRRRRYGRAVACAICCKRFNGGRYDERFKLRGHRIEHRS